MYFALIYLLNLSFGQAGLMPVMIAKLKNRRYEQQ
jgi:hypothetical protein